MTPIDSKKYSRLKELAARVNKESDGLNDIITAFEQKLSVLNIGISAWTNGQYDVKEYTDDKDRLCTSGYKFGYAKLGDSWRLCTKCVHEFTEGTRDNYGELEWTQFNEDAPIPLVNAPRHLRIEMVGAFDKLMDILSDIAERYLKTLEEAKVTASE